MLSESVKDKLLNEVYEARVNYIHDCIGDIAKYGCGYKDLYEMTDLELVVEYEEDVICLEDFEDGEVDELQQEARAELAINKMLKG